MVLDVYSCRVVGWSMETHLRTELILAALTQRFRSPSGNEGPFWLTLIGDMKDSPSRIADCGASFRASPRRVPSGAALSALASDGLGA
jgi:transposase InsO family protein